MYREAKKFFVVWRAQRDSAEKTLEFGLGINQLQEMKIKV
jgi:hypothetical protein